MSASMMVTRKLEVLRSVHKPLTNLKFPNLTDYCSLISLMWTTTSHTTVVHKIQGTNLRSRLERHVNIWITFSNAKQKKNNQRPAHKH